MAPQHFDAVLVGGGLHGALIALALLEHHPESRLAIVERAPRTAGEHTWCFHEGDLPADARPFVEPLIQFRWEGYDVVFPGLERRLDSRYAGFTSDRLRAHLEATFTASGTRIDRQILVDSEVVQVAEDHVELADGQRLHGRLIIDARGPASGPRPTGTGYQVFLGHELQLAAPHGLTRPILMDATVPQQGGYRFVYVLPLGPDRLLVEDTRFSDEPALPRDELSAGIDSYCRARGWQVTERRREEEGVLPMPWAGTAPRPERSPLLGGYGGGWMHPATGYSFPVAVRLAALIGRLGVSGCFEPSGRFAAELRTFAGRHGRQLRFAHLLNRLLFRWFDPADRVDVFRRFYRLPEARIRRFYALQTTATDRLRLLVGKPPRGFSLRARLHPRRPSHDFVSI